MAHVFIRPHGDGYGDADDSSCDCDDAADDGGGYDDVCDGDNCDEDNDQLSSMRLSWRMYSDAYIVMVMVMRMLIMVIVIVMMTPVMMMVVTMILLMVRMVMLKVMSYRPCAFHGVCIQMLEW